MIRIFESFNETSTNHEEDQIYYHAKYVINENLRYLKDKNGSSSSCFNDNVLFGLHFSYCYIFPWRKIGGLWLFCKPIYCTTTREIL